MEITSVNNQLVKDTVKLYQKKYRDELDLFIVEGYHLYEEASKFDIIKDIFTTDRAIKGNNVNYVSDLVLAKLAKTKSPQSILCVCHKIKKEEITDRVLILEGIQDPGNLGTLLRSALAFNYKTIILDNTVDIYNDKVISSTQGAMFNLNIIEMKVADFVNKHSEYKIFGTSLDGVPLESIKQNNNIAIILGNEGQGLSKDTLGKTTDNITIKTNNVNSLNVGVAGSIIMHHINNV